MLFVLLLALFWSRAAVYPLAVEQIGGSDVPLGRLLGRLTLGAPFVEPLVLFAILSANALLAASIVNRMMLFGVRNYLPIVFYAVVACGVFIPGNMIVLLTASLLVMSGADGFVAGQGRGASLSLMLRGALLIGSAGLVYAPATVFAVLIPAAVYFFRMGKRYLVVGVVGGVLPLLFCSYVYWAIGKGFTTPSVEIFQAIFDGDFEGGFLRGWGIGRVVFLGILLLNTIFSLATLTMRNLVRDRARRTTGFFVFFFVLTLLLFLLPGPAGMNFVFVALPLSVILPAWYVKYSGWFPTLLFILLLASAVFTNLEPFLS